MTNVWGVHTDRFNTELVERGFLHRLRRDGPRPARGRLRPRGVQGGAHCCVAGRKASGDCWLGNILLRFGAEITERDVVVAPFQPDNTINVGVVTGPYEFHAEEPTHRHHRKVRWEKLGVSRTGITQTALYEIGSLLTVFGIRKRPQEFLAVLNSSGEDQFEDAVSQVLTVDLDVATEATAADEPRASRIDRHTRDFVLNTLKSNLSHLEFEEFTADLLRAMGYEARVTQYSQHDGVDIIAYRDPLGIDPPLIKVQCKLLTETMGAPDVQQLVGTLGHNELSLFVTLGELVDLVLRHSANISQRWRLRVLLTPVLGVDDSGDQ